MTLHELKAQLQQQNTLAFELPDGSLVPSHFHITEVGKVTKNFIDCGGVIRKEEVISLQLWEANDYDHRLHPEKMLQIIEIAEKTFNLKDSPLEVEYQGNTIQKYGLEFEGNNYMLTEKQTTCLAREKCGIPEPSKGEINSCDPGSGCC